MIWNVSPIAFTLSIGSWHWPVHWYGLLFGSTFIYGLFIFRYMYRLEGRPPDDVHDLVLAVIGGTLVGARLGHVFFYNPQHFLSNPAKILAVWQGGLASHGAVVGILIAVWLFSRAKENQGFLWVCDRIGLSVPLSGCLIRIGNFFNSEILGTPTLAPWGVIFARVDDIPRHPVQLYEAACYLMIFLLQFSYYRRHVGRIPDGYLLGRFFVMVFGARFVLEQFKQVHSPIPVHWWLSMGQVLSLPLIVLGLGLLFWSRQRARKASIDRDRTRQAS
ncbi:MAG: prolipoprotein diacylglyceryl transferase [Methylotetracoccus sp.]